MAVDLVPATIGAASTPDDGPGAAPEGTPVEVEHFASNVTGRR